MEDKYAGPTFYLAIATTVLSVVSVGIGYTSSPIYLGNRPNLTHEVHYSNSNVPVNGKFEGRAVIVIKNNSRYPAKDVYVVLKSLNDGSGWSFNSEKVHVEEVSSLNKKKKVLLFKTIPADSEVTLECNQLVPNFEKFAFVDFSVSEHLDCTYAYVYSPQVTSVYSDFGQSVEQKHESTECVCPMADDCRGSAQQVANSR